MKSEKVDLEVFQSHDKFEISSWDLSTNDLLFWANITDLKKDLVQRFDEWHRDTDGQAFTLKSNSTVVGYGELWTGHQEVELARLLIMPSVRGKGFGKLLLRALLQRAKSREHKIWLRVHPDNHNAKSLYLRNGFMIAANDLQKQFNHQQALQFVWMEAVTELTK